MNRPNDSDSDDSDSTVTVVSKQHTPEYDPAEWEVLTDADSLDTAYDNDVCAYGRQVTAKLAKKRERERRNQNT